MKCPAIHLLLVLVSLAAPADAEQWGNVTGKLVLAGTPPKLPELDTTGDDFCSHANPHNESLKLGDDQAIANVLVYLRPARGEAIAVHPDYDTTGENPAELDNKGCSFTPHVVLVRTGQPLVLKNTDATTHSIKGELGDEAFNFMLAAQGEQQLEFTIAQRVPRPVGCSIHPYMRAWMLVRDDPYMAASDADGEFTIANLPAGEHELQFWHERPGYLKNCKSDSVELDRRGRLTVTIEPGATLDLGVIEVDSALMAAEDD